MYISLTENFFEEKRLNFQQNSISYSMKVMIAMMNCRVEIPPGVLHHLKKVQAKLIKKLTGIYLSSSLTCVIIYFCKKELCISSNFLKDKN